jgi:hypothetical protein
MERPDGQQRWDQAYQSILRWSLQAPRAFDPSANGKDDDLMRAAVYVRVSTSRQVKLQTIDQQMEIVQKHAREQGWVQPKENIFGDDGYSGTTLKHPALDALRDKACLRELEVVVVLSRDRLAQLRSPDGLNRGVREGWLPGGVRGEADELRA